MLRKSALLSTIGLLAGLLAWRLIAALIVPGAVETDLQRLELSLGALFPALIVLALMILAQMAARARAQAFDPTAGKETRFLLVNQRVITNTVEQLAVFAPALLALAVRSNPDQMNSVVALGFLFAGARLVFWAGYLRAPLLRAPGMAATAAATMATLLAALWVWLL
jgi:uncharacterized membrane protein YecN with MAPEG domain